MCVITTAGAFFCLTAAERNRGAPRVPPPVSLSSPLYRTRLNAVRGRALASGPPRKNVPAPGVVSSLAFTTTERRPMFYSLTLERELELAPRFFGPRMREVLQQKLVSEVRKRVPGRNCVLVLLGGRAGGGRLSLPLSLARRERAHA